MRTLLAILALTLGCIGCQNKPAEAGDRPSFYDSNNIAEYYGRCPKCQRWVKGYFTNLHYVDASGRPGATSGIMGTCEHCKAELFEAGLASFTNRSRIITWRVPK